VRVEVQSYSGSSESDQARIIYKTSLTPDKAANVNWSEARMEDIEKIWIVQENLIPSLQFIQVSG
jgi:hypothetical protein